MLVPSITVGCKQTSPDGEMDAVCTDGVAGPTGEGDDCSVVHVASTVAVSDGAATVTTEIRGKPVHNVEVKGDGPDGMDTARTDTAGKEADDEGKLADGNKDWSRP